MKLNKASNMQIDESLFKILTHLLEYRKNRAIELLKNSNEDTYKDLKNIYEYCNDKIKIILNL